MIPLQPPLRPFADSPLRSRDKKWTSVALMTVAVAAVTSVWLITRTMTHVADSMGDMFKPSVNSTVLLAGTVRDMRERLQLAVEEADIDAEVTKSESYYWWNIYFGTTSVRIRAPGCHVLYVIPLQAFTTSNLEAVVLPNGKRILKVKLPEPQVNEDVVEVNYDNLEVEAASGWARFNKNEVAEKAMKLLRPAAIAEAKRPWNMKAVKVDAEVMMRRLLDPLSESLQPDVKVELEFTQKN